MVTWMATTEAWTALETASQFGVVGRRAGDRDGVVAVLADGGERRRAAGRRRVVVGQRVHDAPVATAATIAAAAAAETTGIHVRRLRCVGTCRGAGGRDGLARVAAAGCGTWPGRAAAVRDAACPTGRGGLLLERAPGPAPRRAGRRPAGRAGRPRPARPAAALGGLVRGALVGRGGRVRRRERVGRVRRGSDRQRLRRLDGRKRLGRAATGGERLGRRAVWGVLVGGWSAGRLVGAVLGGAWSSCVASLVEVHHTGPRWRHPSQNLGIGCEFRMDPGLQSWQRVRDRRGDLARRAARRARGGRSGRRGPPRRSAPVPGAASAGSSPSTSPTRVCRTP